MSELVKRSLTGIVFLAVIIGSIVWRSSAFGAIFSLVTFLGLYEFYNMISLKSANPNKLYGALTGTTIFVLNYLIAFNWAPVSVLLIIIPFLFLIFIYELFSANEKPVLNIAYSIMGIVYVAIPLSLLNYIIAYSMYYFRDLHSPFLLLGVFIIIWTNDTFAYVVGSLLGRNKMFVSVSPKKSWEGAFGGLIFSLIVAYFISFEFKILLTYEWLILALITVVFGNIGDFIESMIKRYVNIKDSGNWLPGHGGILDRFDSIIFAAPFVFTYLLLLSLLK